jgi:hypothetical protein
MHLSLYIKSMTMDKIYILFEQEQIQLTLTHQFIEESGALHHSSFYISWGVQGP